MKRSERDFLLGLAKLTRETGIKIHGCGCCGSPDMVEAEITSDESGYADDCQVMWIDPSDEYDWNKLRSKIVRD